MRIDSHQHFWHYHPETYKWIDDSMAAIRRDYLPLHLLGEITQAGVDAVVAVEARPSLEETRWLLDLAETTPFIKGVVGWGPLADPQFEKKLGPHLVSHKLKGLRHVAQGEKDGFLDGPAFNRGIGSLKRKNLSFDICVYEHQLPEVIRFVDRHPNQIFILDHIGKPRIIDNLLEPWATRMSELAKRPHVFCKLSGLVTEANFKQWTEPQLGPYLETTLESFGPGRLMVGSDWPVCQVAVSYRAWFEILTRFLAPLGASERKRIEYENATAAYRL